MNDVSEQTIRIMLTVPPMLFWGMYEAGHGGMKGCEGMIECGGMKGSGGIDGGGSRARMICCYWWSLQQSPRYLSSVDISEEAVGTDAVGTEDRHREGEPVQQVARRTKPTAKHTFRPTPPGLIRGSRLPVVHMVRVYPMVLPSPSLLQQACACPTGT